MVSGVRSHPSLARIAVVAVTLVIVASFAQRESTQAGPPADPAPPQSILPKGVGRGIGTSQPVVLTFDAAVDPSLAAQLRIEPFAAFELAWSDDRRSVSVAPAGRWRTDTRYLISLPGSYGGGGSGEAQEFSFTTQTAPTVLEFLVAPAGTDELAALAGSTALLKEDRASATGAAHPTGGPASATADASGLTEVSIVFDRPMDRGEAEAAFSIAPEVEGTLAWSGDRLTFHPLSRLGPDERYTVSVVGARDLAGNPVDADAVFSLTVRPVSQLVKIRPQVNATGITAEEVSLWFSQPMDRSAVSEAFALVDLTTGDEVAGSLTWNETSTSVTFSPDDDLAAGHRFETRLDAASADADGHTITGAWRFSTRAVVAAVTRRTVPAPAPAADAVAYALNQVNAARAAYGVAPVVLDPAITAVASGHAWDMLTYGYFSHYGRDGSSVRTRLQRGGVSFSYSGENICSNGRGNVFRALDWCHGIFMAEPYPGYWNHIANILNPRFTRLGVGIAQGGSTVIIVWDFAG